MSDFQRPMGVTGPCPADQYEEKNALHEHCAKLANATMPKIVGCTAQLIWSRPREAVAVVRDAIYNAAAPLRQMNRVLGKELARVREELELVDKAREHHFRMVRQREHELGRYEEERKKKAADMLKLLAELDERDRRIEGLVEDNYRLMERANRAEAFDFEAVTKVRRAEAARLDTIHQHQDLMGHVGKLRRQLEQAEKTLAATNKRASEEVDALQKALAVAKSGGATLTRHLSEAREELKHSLDGKTAQANVIADYQKRFHTTKSTILAVQALLDRDQYRAARMALSALLRDLDERYYEGSPSTPDSFYKAVQGALRLLGMNDRAGATAVLAGLLGDRHDG